MSFVYSQYIVRQTAGFAVNPLSWDGWFLALVDATYVPDKDADSDFTDIPGGAVVNDGTAGPNITPTGGSAGPIGLKLTKDSPIEVWPAVSGGTVVALVLYGSFAGGTQRPLVCYFDNWLGLPLIPSGIDVPLDSLPTVVDGVNAYRYVTANT
jgi:hypothetical protein